MQSEIYFVIYLAIYFVFFLNFSFYFYDQVLLHIPAYCAPIECFLLLNGDAEYRVREDK